MAHFVFYDLPRDVSDKITDLRAEMAANRFLLAGYRLSALLAKANFNPNQPRIPLGNPRGGEWTRVPGWTKPRASTGDVSGGANDARQPRLIPAVLRIPAGEPDAGRPAGEGFTRVAVATGPQGYPVDLLKEERLGGHTISVHVGKTPETLLGVVRRDRGRVGFIVYARQRYGTFPSIAAAARLVNSTLARNSGTVALVAAGRRRQAFLKAQFGSKTGIEAYSAGIYANPYLRDTYGVGVQIEHDPRAKKGYRVITAYPRND